MCHKLKATLVELSGSAVYEGNDCNILVEIEQFSELMANKLREPPNVFPEGMLFTFCFFSFLGCGEAHTQQQQ